MRWQRRKYYTRVKKRSSLNASSSSSPCRQNNKSVITVILNPPAWKEPVLWGRILLFWQRGQVEEERKRRRMRRRKKKGRQGRRRSQPGQGAGVTGALWTPSSSDGWSWPERASGEAQEGRDGGQWVCSPTLVTPLSDTRHHLDSVIQVMARIRQMCCLITV